MLFSPVLVLIATCFVIEPAREIPFSDGFDGAAYFESTIAPLIASRCLDCHSGSKPDGKLDLSRLETALAGGSSGAAIVPGNSDDSLMWQRVVDGEMPPKHPLVEGEKSILQSWIAAGASWGHGPIDRFRYSTDRRAGYDWWSLKPLTDAPLPQVRNLDWARNEIDQFILAKLEEKGLVPSAQADPRSLLKRLFIDLVGLPPSVEEVDAFVADSSDRAYEAIVDRLLCSPLHGERWARHWLDVVRYGESSGFERNDPRTNAWPFRDWVIDSLNADLPYDQFVRMQLAGDLLTDASEGVVAAGFLVAGVHNTVVGLSERMKLLARQDELEEIAGTVGQTFLGLTVHCARCHDHKFDPIPSKDYYRFISALDGVNHGERKLTGRDDGPQPQTTIYSIVPGTPGVMRVHSRGNVTDLADEVAPGAIQALSSSTDHFGLAPNASDRQRRRALADWVTDPANPIFNRVIVNRVWHYHFGTGIVDSPNDFGFNGDRPSHPELLDWLARRFVTDGQSLKSLHRLIVLSSTYRQSSASNPTAEAKDSGNRLLWRHAPRRVDAEVLRDSILQAAGDLYLRKGGPGFTDVSITPNNGTTYYEPIDPIGLEFNRRTIYRFAPRGASSTLLDAFDCPDSSTTTPRRSITTTPLQALGLLNNSFVLRAADRMATRVAAHPGEELTEQARCVWRIAVLREPDPNELRASLELSRKHGLSTLCRALFNSNEFLFID
jgi:Protein of unknown function (DUF1553)/Protein of unknown function (DUF1549)/Planctomycete cytochrome C